MALDAVEDQYFENSDETGNTIKVDEAVWLEPVITEEVLGGGDGHGFLSSLAAARKFAVSKWHQHGPVDDTVHDDKYVNNREEHAEVESFARLRRLDRR